MTRTEFWNQLDTVCASPNRSVSLLALSRLLQQAYQEDLPVLIACTRTPGRIHHSYANFQEGGEALAGNRYLICFTSPSQSRLSIAPVQEEETPLSLEERFKRIDEEASTAPAVEPSLSLEERFRLIDEGANIASPKKARRRRKKATSLGPMWKASPVQETATVRTRDVLDYMRRSRAIGGLVFNIYDEKHSVALPKFMIG